MQFVKQLTPSKYVAAEGWYVREHGGSKAHLDVIDGDDHQDLSKSFLNDHVVSSIVDEEKIITITPNQRVVPQEARIIEDIAFIEPAKTEELPSVAREALVQGVWFTANLAVEGEEFFPQLSIQVNSKSKGDVYALHVNLLESGISQLAHAGFYGDGWKLFKTNDCARLRCAYGTNNVRQAFIVLNQIVNAAIQRSGLPFGRSIEIF